jgi:hypothetical protein
MFQDDACHRTLDIKQIEIAFHERWRQHRHIFIVPLLDPAPGFVPLNADFQ